MKRLARPPGLPAQAEPPVPELVLALAPGLALEQELGEVRARVVGPERERAAGQPLESPGQ